MPAKWKLKEVEDLRKKLDANQVVGVASISGFPSKQLQHLRKKLKGLVEISVVKNRLVRRAIEKSKRKEILKKLEDRIDGPVAFVFTNESPFKLNKALNESKSKAPAKPGDLAPFDIIVPAGDTPFKPGPVIGELQKVGIKAKIQGPIIVVSSDSKVADKGAPISKELSSVLTRLGIFPMEVGLDLRVACEGGLIYDSEALAIDSDRTFADIQKAFNSALNLSYNVGLFNKGVMPLLLSKAGSNAINLAYNAKIISESNVGSFLSKGCAEAKALAIGMCWDTGKAATESGAKGEKKEAHDQAEAKADAGVEAQVEAKVEAQAEEKTEDRGQKIEGAGDLAPKTSAPEGRAKKAKKGGQEKPKKADKVAKPSKKRDNA